MANANHLQKKSILGANDKKTITSSHYDINICHVNEHGTSKTKETRESKNP